MTIIHIRRAGPLLILCAALASGCQSAYYNALEEFGVYKRDLLVSRVEDAKESQQAAKAQFQTAYEAFQNVTGYEGGELEARYKALNAEYEQSQQSAQTVHERIDAVDDVAQALFDEWEGELDEYSNDELRRDSEQELEATKRRYGHLIEAMRAAEEKLDPVLAAFQDQVLALKHNLNARAIASLSDERTPVQAHVAALVSQMNASIKEAETFLATIKSEPDKGNDT
jgi:uncharacterized protein YukE